jgi:hypothetical protein
MIATCSIDYWLLSNLTQENQNGHVFLGKDNSVRMDFCAEMSTITSMNIYTPDTLLKLFYFI